MTLADGKAIDLLHAQHQTIANLIADVEEAQDLDAKRDLFLGLREALELHDYVEERGLYPACLARLEIKDLIERFLEDHAEIVALMNDVEEVRDEYQFNKKLEELIDFVSHHISDEEQVLFERLRLAFSAEELEDLGLEMKAAEATWARQAA